MVAHSTLTGSDLHEPKGAATAASGTVYVSDGAGSGSWSSIGPNSLNGSTVKNVNKGKLYLTFPDVSTAGSIYVPISSNCTITAITSTLQGPITGADNSLTFYNGAGASMGNMTIAYAGSAAGDVDILNPASNNSMSAGQNLRITTSGSSTGAYNLIICVDYTLT